MAELNSNLFDYKTCALDGSLQTKIYKVKSKRHGESSKSLRGPERVRESLMKEVAFE